MDFDDFLIKSFAANPDKIDGFLERQISIRDLFKEKGQEISWLLDLSHVLFIIKNFKTGAHFKLKKASLVEALDFCELNIELDFEKKQFQDFLK